MKRVRESVRRTTGEGGSKSKVALLWLVAGLIFLGWLGLERLHGVMRIWEGLMGGMHGHTSIVHSASGTWVGGWGGQDGLALIAQQEERASRLFLFLGRDG